MIRLFKQAGDELCQAQFRLGITTPALKMRKSSIQISRSTNFASHGILKLGYPEQCHNNCFNFGFDFNSFGLNYSFEVVFHFQNIEVIVHFQKY